MGFNENTQFPVFAKNIAKKDSYIYLSMYCCFTLYSNKKDYYFELNEENIPLFVDEEEVQISKEEFIEANKDLLEKTGLMNLFYPNMKSVLEVAISEIEMQEENRKLKGKVKYLEDIQTQNDFEIDGLKNQIKNE